MIFLKKTIISPLASQKPSLILKGPTLFFFIVTIRWFCLFLIAWEKEK